MGYRLWTVSHTQSLTRVLNNTQKEVLMMEHNMEQVANMNAPELMAYVKERNMTRDQKQELTKQLTEYHQQQDFKEAVEDVIKECEMVKTDRKCSSECAATLVNIAYQKMILDALHDIWNNLPG